MLFTYYRRYGYTITSKIMWKCENVNTRRFLHIDLISYIFLFLFKDALCTKQEADKGPCFSALQHEIQMEAAEGSKLKSSSCKRYLEDLLNKCSWRNTTYTSGDCHNHCSKWYHVFLSFIWLVIIEDIKVRKKAGWNLQCFSIFSLNKKLNCYWNWSTLIKRRWIGIESFLFQILKYLFISKRY